MTGIVWNRIKVHKTYAIHTQTHIHTHTDTHIHTHTYTHIHIHTQPHAQISRFSVAVASDLPQAGGEAQPA